MAKIAFISLQTCVRCSRNDFLRFNNADTFGSCSTQIYINTYFSCVNSVLDSPGKYWTLVLLLDGKSEYVAHA